VGCADRRGSIASFWGRNDWSEEKSFGLGFGKEAPGGIRPGADGGSELERLCRNPMCAGNVRVTENWGSNIGGGQRPHLEGGRDWLVKRGNQAEGKMWSRWFRWGFKSDGRHLLDKNSIDVVTAALQM